MPGRVTYSRSLTIIPTYRCHLRCQYCSFWSPTDGMLPARLADAMLASAAADGCREILIMTGERPWLEPGFPLDEDGFFDYLVDLCRRALRLGLLPHTNVGVFDARHLEGLQRVNASLGLMLESTNDALTVHKWRGKRVAERIGFIEECGERRIPFTSGLLVGIGESEADRVDTLRALWERHERRGHLQEIIVQNFRQRPQTPLAGAPEPTEGVMLDTVRRARVLLPGIGIQIPPNLNRNYLELVLAGADDFGGVSADVDHINPEHRWPEPKRMAAELAGIGYVLKERLPVYPETSGRLDPVANELRDLLLPGAPAVVRSVAIALEDARSGARAVGTVDEVWLTGGEGATLSDWVAAVRSVRLRTGSVPVVGASVDEVRRLALTAGVSVDEGLAALRGAGLSRLGGDDRLLEDGPESAAWIAAAAAAARAELTSLAVLPVRPRDDWPARVDHLERLRALQLAHVAFDALEVRPESGVESAAVLHATAFARLFNGRELPRLRVDWLTAGAEVAALALHHGADHVGPTRVSRSGRTLEFPGSLLPKGTRGGDVEVGGIASALAGSRS